MCGRILLVALFAVLVVAVFVSNALGHLRGVGDAETKMMRNLSRAILIYHDELGSFLDPLARDQAAELQQKFGVVTNITVRDIEHTGVKGFVFANVTRDGIDHSETIMFGQGTVWYISSESASD